MTVLVNPYDRESMAGAIARALSMPWEERSKRMERLKNEVETRDVMWWLNSFLKAAVEKDLEGFAGVDEYFPATSLPCVPVTEI